VTRRIGYLTWSFVSHRFSALPTITRCSACWDGLLTDSSHLRRLEFETEIDGYLTPLESNVFHAESVRKR
jgi:hypothetical protein